MFVRSIKRVFMRVARLLHRAWSGLVGGGWRQVVLRLAILAGLATSGGFIYVWLGLVPIAASSGHWPATRWFLHFAMRNAVETRAIGVDAPALDDPGLILKGAGYYAIGCAPCHGAPGEARSLIVKQMVPEPPRLAPKIPEWQSDELFWIVRNGIKYTAMPAWVSVQREDEVWAMVAFLQQLPELTPQGYRQLAYGSQAEPAVEVRELTALKNCARCHGMNGTGRGTGAFPKLAGQNEAYLFASLRAYALGERHSGIMQPIAAGLNEKTLHSLAEYYANLSPGRTTSVEDTAATKEAIKRGALIATRGLPEQGIPACAECHGPEQPRNPVFPKLAGQYADYLALQLSLFKANQRGGTPYAHIMQTIAERLTHQQIQDLALYYAFLPDDELGSTSAHVP